MYIFTVKSGISARPVKHHLKYTRIHIYTHTRARAHIHMHRHVRMRGCTHTYTHARAHNHIQTRSPVFQWVIKIFSGYTTEQDARPVNQKMNSKMTLKSGVKFGVVNVN